MNPKKLPLRLAERLRKPEGTDKTAWGKGALVPALAQVEALPVVLPADEAQAADVPQGQEKPPGEVWADDGLRGRDGAVVLADASGSMGMATGDSVGRVATDALPSVWTLAQADAATSERLGAAAQECEPQRQNDESCDDRGGLFWWLKGSEAFVPLGLGLGAGLLTAASGSQAGPALLDVALGAGPFKSGVFVIQIFDQHGLLFTLSWDDAGHVRTQSKLAQAGDVQVHTSTTVDGHTVVTGLSLNFGSHTGPVMAVLYDPDTTDGKPIEYFDEVAGVIALDSSLRAMTTLHEGNNYMAITPFTELAARLALGQQHSAGADYPLVLNTSQEVLALEAANKTVSDWLGVNVVSDLPIAVNDVAYATQTSSAAKSYGDALAALSRLVPGTLLGGVEKLLSTAAASSHSAADVSALLQQALTDYHNEVSGVTPLIVSLDAAVTAKTLLNASDVAQLYINGSSLNAPEGSLVQVVLTDVAGQVHALQALVDAQGNWSVAMPTGLPDGVLQVSAYIDAHRPVDLALTLDSTAPTAPLDVPIMLPGSDTGGSDHDGITRDARPAFAVASLPVDVAEVQLMVDGVVVAATYDNLAHTLRPDAALGDGQHQISYRYVDAAGNASAASSNQRFVLDSTAPVMLASSGTGLSNHDGITHDARPVFTVASLPADATGMALLVDGVVVAATYDSHAHTLRPDVALSDGQLQISYRYVDAAGNASAASSSLVVDIDTTAPHGSAITGVSPSTLSGTYEPGCTLALSIAGVAVTGAITLHSNGSWSYTPSPAELQYLSTHDGTELKLVVTDGADNAATVSQTVMASDFGVPQIVEFIPADSGVLANDANGHATLNVVFSKAVYAGTGDIKVFDFSNQLVAAVPVNGPGVRIEGDGLNDVYVTLPGLTMGTHYYVTFDAGTFVDANHQAFAGQLQTGGNGWDLTAVTASIAPDFVAADDRVNAAERGAPVVIGGRVVSSSAVLSAITTGDLAVDVRDASNQPVAATVTGYDLSTGAFTFAVAANAWAEGTYHYTVNLAGHSGAASGVSANYSFNNLVVDLTAPTMTASLQGAQDDAGSQTGELWPGTTVLASSDDSSPYLSGSLSAALTGDARVVVYRQDVTDPNHLGAMQKITGVEGLQSSGLVWGVSDSGLQDGHVYQYTASVEDAAGNRSASGVSRSIAIDMTAPITQISALRLSQDAGNSNTDWVTNVVNQSIRASLSAPLSAGEKLLGSLDGGLTWTDISSRVTTTGAISADDTVVTFTVLNWSGVTLQQGQGTVILKVVDAAGNAGPAASQAYTLDTTAPLAPTVDPVAVNEGATTVLTGLATLGAGEQLTVTVNGATYAVSPVNGAWRLDLGTATPTSGSLGQFAAGQSYDVQASVKDVAGNSISDSTHAEISINPAARLAVPIYLSDIAAGSGGFAISGQVDKGQSGISVSNAGDVNGDGLDDLIIGSYPIWPANISPTTYNPGKSYVVFGKTTNSGIDLSAVMAGSGGFVINGISVGDVAGSVVSGAGDVNGDGLADLIVGAPGLNGGGGTGRSYVVFGKSTGTAIDVSAVERGVGGFAIMGQSTNDQAGISVAAAGDVNGDGLADLIVGASTSDPAAGMDAGRSYVVFGKGTGTTVNLSAVAAGVGGFAINGQFAGEQTGYTVDGAGDVNGDGLSDVLIGAFNPSNPTSNAVGHAYVVFGKSAGASIDLSAVASGIGGFVINGQSIGDAFGANVSYAGDVNGDGLADVIVGASWNNSAAGSYAGRSYVVFGKSTGAAMDLSAVAAGSGGFVINGESAFDMSGMFISNAGDVNGDGLADLLVGAKGSNSSGRSWLIYGKASGAAIDLSAVSAGSEGFEINGQSANDWSNRVSPAGDVNGDGLADLLVAGTGFGRAAVNVAGQGRSYVIFGGTTGAFADTAVDSLGTSGDDSYAATAPAQTLVAGAGNDTLSANGAMVVYGGAGDDTFVLDAGMLTALTTNGLSSGVLARIDGGSGVDTIKLSGSGLTLDLTQIANQAAGGASGGSRINSVECVDLTGAGNETLKLTVRDVLDMSGFNSFAATGRHQLLVKADASNVIDLADGTDTTGWTHAADTVISGVAYQTWNNNTLLATVYIDQNGVVV